MDSPFQQWMISHILQEKQIWKISNIWFNQSQKKKKIDEGVTISGKGIVITVFKWEIKIDKSKLM